MFGWVRRKLRRRKLMRKARTCTRAAAWHRRLLKDSEEELTLPVVERIVRDARAERNIRLLRDAAATWRELKRKENR